MQTYNLNRPKATEILSTPPKSGVISVYSTKLTALVLVWLCSIIVWANQSNWAGVRSDCGSRCGVTIGFALFIFLYTTVLLIMNWFTEKGTMSRIGCFSHGVEVQWIGGLVLFWIPVVAATSKVPVAPALVAWFAWGGFFASTYATYKAYHSFKEEDLPSRLPEGYEEEDYVYG